MKINEHRWKSMKINGFGWGRPRVARARLGVLGQGRAGFWVMENGSSGGACLDICRYLQLSHQVSHTPQSPSGGRIEHASRSTAGASLCIDLLGICLEGFAQK